ncbi:magnesium-translocating P-type ATPase [Nitrospirillum sp. BR 11164]|uniref:magnesium-translocating P-type ATPase n=1 Tax=Nitrospirillum sp. BR 11164 TaxID=3104324 RepID=UPI002AFFEE22|nr:magnesium-translocating P-type ATPase [Nitrospirillum sp. BR 11164]MEA1648019.1 magnesium-translocating P-type ATPase [Nitrospirillum sp. BR 11164]
MTMMAHGRHREPMQNTSPPATWTLPLADLLAALPADAAGLTSAEAQRRQRQWGPNQVLGHRRRPAWLDFLARFANPLVLILLFASALSAATGNTSSFVIVAVVVLLSVVLDFIQERQAEAAVEALRRTVAVRVQVWRDGDETTVPLEQLVPGDVVRLAAGDLVPADCRVLEARDLFVNQAILTGEPYPVEKRAEAGPLPAGTPGEATACLFMGTSVLAGSARAVVCLTGGATLFGQMSRGLQSMAPPTAFETGVRRFGFLILRLTFFLVLFVLSVNTLFHRPWLDSLMFALALAVGLTPELLPMIVTVTLARGALRLAERRVIVKRLASMHNVGAMDVLCTDKTGTLTQAAIHLVRTLDCDGKDAPHLFELAYINSRFETGLHSPMDDAILARGQIDMASWRKCDEVPFDFERRRVSVLADHGGTKLLVVKGAPEDMLRLSGQWRGPGGMLHSLDEDARARLDAQFQSLGREGHRVLAVATKALPPDREHIDRADECDLVFEGHLAFLDPPKASATAAVTALAQAGVDIKILTGDTEAVSRHLCAQLTLPITGLLTGDELQAMTSEALHARLKEVNVFCRVTPQQKERVLMACRRAGHVVGFMGDGVNDAAALHAADVGISVDSAADVAKEAASLILLDQDLSVVHEAVLEGRRTVLNVTKYVLMGSSSNFGNMFSMAGAALFLPFLPMLPVQVLLNNLLYDASEAGIPFDRVEEEALARPVRWNLPLILRFMLVLGPVSSLFDFLTFYVLLHLLHAPEALFQTGWFIESLATQVLVIFVIRTPRAPWRGRPHPLLAGLAVSTAALAALLPLTPLGGLFGLVPPPPVFYLFLVGAVAVYLTLTEGVKRLFFKKFS